MLNKLTVTTIAAPSVSTFDYRDGWTITAGVGHAVSEELSVVGTLSWDRGTSRPGANGVLTAGSQTDRYGVALGALYNIYPSVQLKRQFCRRQAYLVLTAFFSSVSSSHSPAVIVNGVSVLLPSSYSTTAT